MRTDRVNTMASSGFTFWPSISVTVGAAAPGLASAFAVLAFASCEAGGGVVSWAPTVATRNRAGIKESIPILLMVNTPIGDKCDRAEQSVANRTANPCTLSSGHAEKLTIAPGEVKSRL